jgi:Phage gp6-like head-tail connector protein
MRRITRVLVPAESLNLVTLDIVKQELSIPADNTAQDARLNRYISQASAQIHTYTQRIFPVQTYRNQYLADWHDGSAAALILSAWPVTQLLTVTEGGVAVTDYTLNAEAGLVWRQDPGAAFAGAWNAETVADFEAGYADIPDDIEAACLRVVTLQNSVHGRDPYLRVREGPTYGREEFWIGNMPMDSGLPADVAQLLKLYMRPVFA